MFKKEKTGGIRAWLGSLGKNVQEEDIEVQLLTRAAQSEEDIKEILNSINFAESKLSKRVLDTKKYDQQPCGDIEYAVQNTVEELNKMKEFPCDISKIDEWLKSYAERLKMAVADGNKRAAFAAKTALNTCTTEIRSKIPLIDPNFRDNYLESCDEYMEIWDQLITVAWSLNEKEQQHKKDEQLRQDTEKKFKKVNEDAREKFREHPDYLRAFKAWKNNKVSKDPTKQTDAEKAVRELFEEMRMTRIKYRLREISFQHKKSQLNIYKESYEQLNERVNQLPEVTDPDFLKKFNNLIASEFKRISKMSVEIDEFFGMMDSWEGNLAKLENSSGMQHITGSLITEIETTAERWEKENKNNTEMTVEEKNNLLKELGLSIQKVSEVISNPNDNQEFNDEEQQEEESNTLHNLN